MTHDLTCSDGSDAPPSCPWSNSSCFETSPRLPVTQGFSRHKRTLDHMRCMIWNRSDCLLRQSTDLLQKCLSLRFTAFLLCRFHKHDTQLGTPPWCRKSCLLVLLLVLLRVLPWHVLSRFRWHAHTELLKAAMFGGVYASSCIPPKLKFIGWICCFFIKYIILLGSKGWGLSVLDQKYYWIIYLIK